MSDDAPTAPVIPGLARLEDQLGWYERAAGSQQNLYWGLKVAQIVIAAAIPACAALGASAGVAGILGALIVVLEGVQQLFRFQDNWIAYRRTAEALKRERQLFLATAGPYATAEHPQRLLAEQVEGLITQETEAWAASRKPTEKPAG